MIRYAVTKGRPDTREQCTVTASIDGEEIAYYKGFFDPYKKLWKLYISRVEGACAVESKLILTERDVHYEVRPAMMERKKNIKKPADPTPEPTGIQMKLR